MRGRPLTVALALLAALPCGRARAQDSGYPDRIVTIVAPSAPGGLYSLFGRILGSKLEQRFGKSFVVENRPGASSVVGALAVARAVPDGYTLMIASGATLAVNVTLHRKLPYDPAEDFVPIALIARVPEVLVVNAQLPVRSLVDLVALGKTRPLTFASAGPGTAQHLEGEMLKSALGLDMLHVPYKGALPALNDVVGGHVAMMFTPIPNALPLIAAGKVRAIGLATGERVAALPDVPPLATIGAPGFEAGGWFMLVAPAATPQPIVARLHAELRAILDDPEVKAEFVRQGLIPVATPSPDELRIFVRREIAYWDRTLHMIGLAGSME
ncbi:MAG TPA: tripartite tricarboxylate transporter substrate binding protein [Xanthobacteraceae bacterium]|jgi:tripartite-type tricarboxylate transporter receptor subunit TctC|nr:tripartite tricarboxylate transporter substrate binding protein [Xanthobacteraceae bacterium]